MQIVVTWRNQHFHADSADYNHLTAVLYFDRFNSTHLLPWMFMHLSLDWIATCNITPMQMIFKLKVLNEEAISRVLLDSEFTNKNHFIVTLKFSHLYGRIDLLFKMWSAIGDILPPGTTCTDWLI